MRGIITAAAIALLATSALAAEEPKRMTAVDFVVDWKDLKGKTVTVTGCSLMAYSSGDDIECSDKAAHFDIDGRSTEKESRRRTLKTCADFEEKAECIANVTGVAAESSLGDPLIRNAKFEWLNP